MNRGTSGCGNEERFITVPIPAPRRAAENEVEVENLG
jgi:hypothetical protein